jgi:hypothetical protein
MIPNQRLKVIFTILLAFTFLVQSCTEDVSHVYSSPTSTVTIAITSTATNFPQTTITLSFTSTPNLAATAVPPGVFALLIYPPLVMDYDVTVWEDESRYADAALKPAYSVLNYLQSLGLETCQIGIQGPTGDFPLTPEGVQLDSVKYEVITFTESPPGFTTAYYIENKSLTGFNYEAGAPVLVVQASLIQWNECKTLAEKVLSTLRVP